MTRAYSFNLLDEPWIPCLRLDGTPVELSLRETLAQAHRLQMVVDDAPQTTAALIRLLLAVMHRIFGPEDYDAWMALWRAEQLDVGKLDAYFARWRHRFDLFDSERPFYQVDDPRVQPKSVTSLKYGVGFLHDQHFDHTSDTAGFRLSPAEAARAVVTLQSFGLGGLSGISEKHVDAPCAGGALFFVHGDSLVQTLLLNLPAYPAESYFLVDDQDAPAWEQENPYDKDRSYPLGLLDYLTWQSRQPVLLPSEGPHDQVWVSGYKLGPGRRLASEVRDPYKVYLVSKQSGYLPLRFSEDKGLWRNSAALFNFGATDSAATRAPVTLRWLAGLVREWDDPWILPRSKTYQCLALGIAKDRGKMLYARQETLPLLPAYLAQPKLVEGLASGLDLTELVGRDLLRAARVAGMYLHIAAAEQTSWKRYAIHSSAAKPISRNAETEVNDWVAHSGVDRAYWAALDVPFQSFLVRLPAEGVTATLAWQQTLNDTALAALETIAAYTPGDGRSLKALVHGRRALMGALRKTLVQLYHAKGAAADSGEDMTEFESELGTDVTDESDDAEEDDE